MQLERSQFPTHAEIERAVVVELAGNAERSAPPTCAEAHAQQMQGYADEINAEAAKAEQAATTATRAALRVGELLAKAKRYLQHGQFGGWITNNTSLSVRTAQAYLRLHLRLKDLPPADAQRVALLPVREAIRAISTSPEAPSRAVGISTSTRPRSERERAYNKFKTAGANWQRARRSLERGGIRPNEVERLRRSLTDALAVLDELVAEFPDNDRRDDGQEHDENAAA